MADLRISGLPDMPSGQLNADDPLAITDISASTTKKIKAADLVADGIALLPNGSIPGAKVSSTLADGSVTTVKLADSAVTAAKLADQSSAGIGATLPATGEFVGQLFVTTTGDPEIWSWNGTSWIEASGTITVQGDTAGLINTYAVTAAGGIATVSADIDNTTAASQFLAGPSNAAGAVAPRVIESGDLPTAGVDKGAVAVDGNGLTMTGDVVGIANSVGANPSANHLVQYDSHGLVIGGSAIQPLDLPVSSTANVGAVKPGAGMAVATDGTFGIANSVVAATWPKITYDTEGLVIAGQDLLETDIPDLGASKIVSGSFPSSRIDDDAITAPKIADYTISFIQEATPQAAVGAHHIGMLWYQESTAGLHMWNGNSWMPVSIGRLSQENLRYCGIIDATSGEILGVTSFGTSAGYSIGDFLNNATDPLTGVYFVVTVAGSGITQQNVGGLSFDTGDWVLCNGAAAGWVRVDTLSGPGGVTVRRLPDLLDVTITTAADKQPLVFDSGTNQWINSTEIDGGEYFV